MDNKILLIASKEAETGVAAGDGGPFGAVITDYEGNVICSGHNMVLKTNDPTAHAEIVTIRKACEILKTNDLSNYKIYSSCEPCPMCLSAIIWSRIKVIYYGATRKDASRIGFKDNDIYEYLDGKNNMIEKIRIKSAECEEVISNYNKEVY